MQFFLLGFYPHNLNLPHSISKFHMPNSLILDYVFPSKFLYNLKILDYFGFLLQFYR